MVEVATAPPGSPVSRSRTPGCRVSYRHDQAHGASAGSWHMRCSGPVLIQEIAGTDAAAARARRRSERPPPHNQRKEGWIPRRELSQSRAGQRHQAHRAQHNRCEAYRSEGRHHRQGPLRGEGWREGRHPDRGQPAAAVAGHEVALPPGNGDGPAGSAGPRGRAPAGTDAFRPLDRHLRAAARSAGRATCPGAGPASPLSRGGAA